ncbi:MAG: cation:proton antiporter [Planctomycetaceae bacterium]|nr:cation:proton antiporter [Planctomycetaceae bacterium]
MSSHRPGRTNRLWLWVAGLSLLGLTVRWSEMSRAEGTALAQQSGAAVESAPEQEFGGGGDTAPGAATGADHADAGESADSGSKTQENGHADPVGPVLIGIMVILLAAKLGGHVFESIGQTAVLGELVFGIVLGNLSLLGYHGLEFLKIDFNHHQTFDVHDSLHLAGITIDNLSRIGVILLLFQVGLESSIGQMLKVGPSALLVAVVGVVVPTALGWGCGHFLLPQHHWSVHMFLGAALCATSVGITARVYQDLRKSTTREARIVLGAAVIDDVLGLVVLAVAQGMIAAQDAAASGLSSEFGVVSVAIIVGKALGFLVAALVLGQFISKHLFSLATMLNGRGLLLATSLLFCFAFSWLANLAGLATIVGAFAAGLILEEVQFRKLKDREGVDHLEHLLRPVMDLLVPIFFVVMGLHVDLRSFADPSMLLLATALTVSAIAGKQACALAVLDRGANRLAVGLGMIPRGEVGLIFAAIGLSLKIGNESVIDSSSYSALVVMVMVTTIVTPPLLKWSMQNVQPDPEG